MTPSFDFSPISPPALAELLELQETGHISSSVAKQVSQLHRPCNFPPLSVTQYTQPQLMLDCILVVVYYTCVLLVSPCSQVFQEMWRSSGKTAQQIIKEQDLGLVSDTAQLHGICQKVVDSHPDEVRAQMPILSCNYIVCLYICFFSRFDMFCVCCASR